MNVFELQTEMNRIRRTRIDSLRSRLEYLYQQNRIIRMASPNGPVYRLNKTPTMLGGSPRLREIDDYLACVRTSVNQSEVVG